MKQKEQQVLSNAKKGPQSVLNGIVEDGRKYNMTINIDKSKMMKISKPDQLLSISMTGDERLDKVKHFKYLDKDDRYYMKSMRI